MEKWYVETELGQVKTAEYKFTASGSRRILVPFYGETLQDAVDKNIKMLVDASKSDRDTVIEYPKHAKITVREETVMDRDENKRVIRHISAEAMIRVHNGYVAGSPNYEESTKMCKIWIREK